MALRMARRLEVRGRPPGRVDGRAGGNTGPRRVGQVGVVESRVHRTVPWPGPALFQDRGVNFSNTL
jgi:hypothetical protein